MLSHFRKYFDIFKGQYWGSPWLLLAPISYNCYTNTFTLIPSDDDKIRPTCTQSCVWNDQIKTDKLTREIHMKQLLVDSMLCFLFDRPVTGNCPILVLKKKKCTRLKKYYQRLRAVPTWFQQRCKWFKSILIFNEYQNKTTISQPEHPLCPIRVFAAWINEPCVLNCLRYRWVDSEKWSDWLIQSLWLKEWNLTRLLDWLLDKFESHYMLKHICLIYSLDHHDMCWKEYLVKVNCTVPACTCACMRQ